MSKRPNESDLDLMRSRKRHKYHQLKKKLEILRKEAEMYSSESDSEGGEQVVTVADVHVTNEPEDVPEGNIEFVINQPDIQIEQIAKNVVTEENAPDGQNLSPFMDIMNLFGKDPLKEANQNKEILPDLAIRFDHALSNGIDKKLREELIEKYRPAVNCNRLIPPVLNEEIAGALKDNKLREDNYLQKLQVTMAAGLMSLYKEIESSVIEKRNVENLANTANLFFESFHEISLHRRYLLSPSLNPQLKKFLEKQPIDKFLYGDNLMEKIKQAQAAKSAATQVSSFVKPKNIGSSYLNYKAQSNRPRMKTYRRPEVPEWRAEGGSSTRIRKKVPAEKPQRTYKRAYQWKPRRD